MVSQIILLVALGISGTILRYNLCKIKINNIFDGLFMSNVFGIVIAIILFSNYPLFVMFFCGTLTSFSTLIKNGFQNGKYLTVHTTAYIFITLIFKNIF